MDKVLIKKLDLSTNGELPLNFIKIMHQNEENVRSKYNELTDKILRKNKKLKYIFLHRSVVRNTYKSNLFLYLCFINTIFQIFKFSGKIDEIITDNKGLYYCIREIILQCGVKTKVILNNKNKFIFITVIKNILVTTNLLILRYIFSRIFFKKKENLKNIILIDTFITKQSFDENFKFNDVFYTGITKYADKKIKKNIYYYPTFYGFVSPFKLYKAYKGIKKSNLNFIINDNYLNLFNFIKCFLISITAPFQLQNIPKWSGINLDYIFKNETYLDVGENSFFQSIVIYKSFIFLKKNNVNIDLAIDWFENQNVDRAFNLSISKNYKNTRTKGYLGVVPVDFNAAVFPTRYESLIKLIPNTIITIGERFNKKIKKYDNQLKVETGPAFRFQNIHQKKRRSKIKLKNILLCLPMHLKDATDIFNLAYESKLDLSYNFIVKTHPLLDKKKIQDLILISNDKKFIFSDENLYDLFDNSEYIITSASSVCLEAISFGLKVIIAGSRTNITKNNLKDIVEEYDWKVCYNSEDMLEFINKNINKVDYDILSFFNSVNRENVNNFLSK